MRVRRGRSAGGAGEALGAALVTVALLGLIAHFGLIAALIAGGLGLFAGTVVAFMRLPQYMAALTVTVLVVDPALKHWVSPDVGPLKDVLVVAAVLAGILHLSTSAGARARADAWLLGGIGVFAALYAANPAGNHGSEWFHGSRLALEAFGLFFAGYVLPRPERTFRVATLALVGMGVLIGCYGIAQQGLGTDKLVNNLGYTFGAQVRETAGGQLRSFGTLDDPFNYASVLLFALAGSVFVLKSKRLIAGVVLVLAVGILAAFVRTAFVLLPLLLVIALVRRRQVTSALAVGLALVVGGLGIAAAIEGNASPDSEAEGFALTLNGRTAVWSQIIDEPQSVVLGRGVGEIGSGAARASVPTAYGGTDETERDEKPAQESSELYALDSSYLAVIADIGFVGLAILIAIFARVGRLIVAAGLLGARTAWFAATLGLIIAIDGLTRTSLTSFPAGFLGLFLLGLALAAAQREAGMVSLSDHERVRRRRALFDAPAGRAHERSPRPRPPTEPQGDLGTMTSPSVGWIRGGLRSLRRASRLLTSGRAFRRRD